MADESETHNEYAPEKEPQIQQLVLRITPTMFETFDRCGAEYNYIYNEGYGGDSKPDYMERGELAHKFLEKYYLLRMYNYDAMEKLPTRQIVEQAVQTAEQFSITTDLDEEDIKKTLEVCRAYVEETKSETWVPIAVEAPFSVVLYESPELKVLLEGKTDLVIDDGERNKCVIDHKLVAADFTPPPTNIQLMCYSIAIGCRNAYLNRLVSTKIPKFRRYPFVFKQSVLDEFKQDLIEAAIEIAERTKVSVFKRRFTSCSKFGKICIFNDVCAAPTAAREGLLKSMFVKRVGSRYGLFPV